MDLNLMERAIATVGSPRELAKLVGVTPQSVWSWQQNGRVPPGRVAEVDRVIADLGMG